MNPLCHLQKQTTFQEPVPDMVHNLRFNLDGCCSSNQNILLAAETFSDCTTTKHASATHCVLGGKNECPIKRWFHVRKRDLAPCCCRPKLLPCPMAPSPPKTRSTACLALASFRRILLTTGLCNGLCPHGRQQNCKRQCSQWSDQGKSRCNLQTCTTTGHSSFHFPTQNL